MKKQVNTYPSILLHFLIDKGKIKHIYTHVMFVTLLF